MAFRLSCSCVAVYRKMVVRLNLKYFSSLCFQLTPSYPDCKTELKCSIQIFDLTQVKLSLKLVTSIVLYSKLCKD